MALNDMRDDWEKKIFSTIFSEKDTTSDEYCLSANMGPEYLYKEDIEEILENYYSDYGIEDLKKIEGIPHIFVFKKSPPTKVDSEDIFYRLESDLCYNAIDNFDYKKVDELLEPLNEYLRKLNVTYDIVGIIDPTEVKPIWEKLLKEWLKEGE